MVRFGSIFVEECPSGIAPNRLEAYGLYAIAQNPSLDYPDDPPNSMALQSGDISHLLRVCCNNTTSIISYWPNSSIVSTLCISSSGNDGCDLCSDRDSFEGVETVESGTDDSSGNLRMPMDLLDILLALMDKQ